MEDFIFFFPLTDFEASFIRLLDKLTNGSRIEINQTGKRLLSVPKSPYMYYIGIPLLLI